MRATTPRTNRNVSDRVTPRRLATPAASRVYVDDQPRRYADAYHAYREARERGETVSLAHTRALTERVVADVLTFRDTFDVAHLGVREAWNVWSLDGRALTRVTSDPRTDALAGTVHDTDGNRVLSRVVVPDLATVYVVAQHDPDANPDDADCYDVDDVDAWKRDEWHYMYVTAHVQLVDGRRGTAGVGGVELGQYWPGSDAAQVWHVVPGVVADAIADAEHTPAHTPAAHTTTEPGALTLSAAEVREVRDALARARAAALGDSNDAEIAAWADLGDVVADVLPGE